MELLLRRYVWEEETGDERSHLDEHWMGGFLERLMSSPHLLWNSAKGMGRPSSPVGHGSIFGRLMNLLHLPWDQVKCGTGLISRPRVDQKQE
jgi:hypothetical protein